jgi:hypothetical protein
VELYKNRLDESEKRKRMEYDRIKFADIITLAGYAIGDFREASREGDTSIRVSNISHLPTVKSLVRQMARHHKIKQVDYSRYLLLIYGVFDLKRRLELRYLYDISRDYGVVTPAMKTLQEIDEEMRDGFVNDRITVKHELNFDRLKRGNEEWIYEYPKGIKYLIHDVCKKFDLLKSDLVNYCIISGLDSFYKKCPPVISSPHAHYYVGGEMVLDVDRCIEDYQASYIGHWFDTIGALKHEYNRDRAILQLNPGRKSNKIDPYLTPDIVRYKASIIADIEKHLEPMDFMTTTTEQAKQQTLEGWFGKFVMGQIDDYITQTSQDKSQSHAKQPGQTAPEAVMQESSQIGIAVKQTSHPTNKSQPHPEQLGQTMPEEVILTLRDLSEDIKLEEWLKTRACPMCRLGNVVELSCDSCGWQYEESAVSA